MTKRILFTGGGTAGHVMVNLALIPEFTRDGWEIFYIGSEKGIEKQLIGAFDAVRYFGIATGKLRRYFDWRNIKDPFRVMRGIYQAYRIIRRIRPAVVFSKGGFVSVPVVLGGWLNGVPIGIHESDLTPGLANRIAMPFAAKVCTTFPEAARSLPAAKAEYTGAIIREELKRGDAARGLEYCGFDRTKPVLLVMGGSLGSKLLNEEVRAVLDMLLRDFQVAHICGERQVDSSIGKPGYKQFEYVDRELPDILAMSDLAVSRAGSNSIFEFLALHKPMLLIPLAKGASRGDQIQNARSFEAAGFAAVLPEEKLTAERLLKEISRLYDNRSVYLANMSKSEIADSLARVIDIIKRTAM